MYLQKTMCHNLMQITCRTDNNRRTLFLPWWTSLSSTRISSSLPRTWYLKDLTKHLPLPPSLHPQTPAPKLSLGHLKIVLSKVLRAREEARPPPRSQLTRPRPSTTQMVHMVVIKEPTRIIISILIITITTTTRRS